MRTLRNDCVKLRRTVSKCSTLLNNPTRYSKIIRPDIIRAEHKATP